MSTLDYEASLKNRFQDILDKLQLAKVSEEFRVVPGEEELYDRVKKGLDYSMSASEAEAVLNEPPTRKGAAVSKPAYHQDYYSQTPTPREQLIRRVELDPQRELAVTYSPERDNYTYSANKFSEKETHNATKHRNMRGYEGPAAPVKTPIADLSVTPGGHVSFVKSGLTGAKERAVDRLLLEAAADGRTPHSRVLLPAGKKMVARKVVDFHNTPKGEYMEIIKKFLNTGKAGKYWSQAGSILKPIAPIGAILGAASYSDAAGAAVDAIIPGGVEELGVIDEQRELDRRYGEILKQRSQ